MNKYTDEGMDRLIEAITVQAANDFRSVFRKKLRGKYISEIQQRHFDEAEGYFESPVYEGFYDIDGEYIINKIMEEEREKHREEIKKLNEQKLA